VVHLTLSHSVSQSEKQEQENENPAPSLGSPGCAVDSQPSLAPGPMTVEPIAEEIRRSTFIDGHEASDAGASGAEHSSPEDWAAPVAALFDDLVDLGQSPTLSWAVSVIGKLGFQVTSKHLHDLAPPQTLNARQMAMQARQAKMQGAAQPEDPKVTKANFTSVASRILAENDGALPLQREPSRPVKHSSVLEVPGAEEIMSPDGRSSSAPDLPHSAFDPAEYFNMIRRAELVDLLKAVGGGKTTLDLEQFVELMMELKLRSVDRKEHSNCVGRLTAILCTFVAEIRDSKSVEKKRKATRDGRRKHATETAALRFLAMVLDTRRIPLPLTKHTMATHIAAGWTEEELVVQHICKAKDRSAAVHSAIALGARYESLFKAGETLPQLQEKGMTLAALRAAGWDSTGAREAGISLADLLAAGFSLHQLLEVQKLKTITDYDALRKAGVTVKQMRACSIPVYDMKLAGFSGTQMVDAGVSPRVVAALRKQITEIASVSITQARQEQEEREAASGKKWKGRSKALLDVASRMVLHSTGVPVASADVPSESLWENIAPQAVMPSPFHSTMRIRDELDMIKASYDALADSGSKKRTFSTTGKTQAGAVQTKAPVRAPQPPSIAKKKPFGGGPRPQARRPSVATFS